MSEHLVIYPGLAAIRCRDEACDLNYHHRADETPGATPTPRAEDTQEEA